MMESTKTGCHKTYICKALSYDFVSIGQIIMKAIVLMYSQVPNKQSVLINRGVG